MGFGIVFAFTQPLPLRTPSRASTVEKSTFEVTHRQRRDSTVGLPLRAGPIPESKAVSRRFIMRVGDQSLTASRIDVKTTGDHRGAWMLSFPWIWTPTLAPSLTTAAGANVNAIDAEAGIVTD